MDLWYLKRFRLPKGPSKETAGSSFAKKPPSKTVENGRKTPVGEKESTASGSSFKKDEVALHLEPDFFSMREPRPLQIAARGVSPKWEVRQKTKPDEVYVDELGRTRGYKEPCPTYYNTRPFPEDFDLPEETLDALSDSMEDANDPLKDYTIRDLQEAMTDPNFLASEEGLREFKRALIDPTVLVPKNITEEEEDLLASFDVLVIDPDFPDVTFVYDKEIGKMVYCE